MIRNATLCVVAVLGAVLLRSTGAAADTTIAINPTNLTGGNADGLEIHGKSNIISIDPNPVPPFTVTSGLGTPMVTLSGGTLAPGASISATVILGAQRSHIDYFAWTVNGGNVVGSSFETYAAFPGVPNGTPAAGCHIALQAISDFKLLEPAGWTGIIDGRTLKLSGPGIGPGTPAKVEVYVIGQGAVPVGNYEWLDDNGHLLALSTPFICFNDTGVEQRHMAFIANALITGIEPMAPLPFTNIVGLGTRTVLLTGGVVPPGDGAGDDQGVVQVQSDVGDDEFVVTGVWLPPFSGCQGDFNCDGTIDFQDIDPFIAELSMGPSCCDGIGYNCDVNGDGRVDFQDVDAFVVLLSTGATCP